MKKISFLLFSSIIIYLFWYIIGNLYTKKDNSNSFTKLQCVSYAPFQKNDSPLNPNFIISENSVRKDLELLSKYTNCIRTYSTIGLEILPKIARDFNLTILLGAWVSSDEVNTQLELDTLINIARENKDIIKAVIVGNEVLLRGDTTDSKLLNYIKYVKNSLPDIKVTYADVWEFWLKYPDIRKTTDFVTIHILPYWEDKPISVTNAIEHVINIRLEVENILNDKNILIGETGWPSEGRMRETAFPSKINQAIYIREFIKIAESKNWNYNIIEAFDQPWKRIHEGAVGGFWGLFDKNRLDKNLFSGNVSNFPNYNILAILSISLFIVFSFLLKNREIQNNQLFKFYFINSIFAILYIFQIEQFLITMRFLSEHIFAGLILISNLIIYFITLNSIATNQKIEILNIRNFSIKNIFNINYIYIVMFYLTIILILISSIKLSFDGRYQNFEIYAFLIYAISFLILYGTKFKNLEFRTFEKMFLIILIATSSIILYNETVFNIFSNIWILISLIFAYILYNGTKNISLKDIKTELIYIILLFIIFSLFKFAFSQKCDSELFLNKIMFCNLKDYIGFLIYFGIFGYFALVLSILSSFFKNIFLINLAIFSSVFAIIMFNSSFGSIAFILALINLYKSNLSK
jgi:exo-beta-1,3-glucanase (GH17 family)